jgi:signal peptidase I
VRAFFKGLLWVAGVLAVIGAILRATILETWIVPNDDPLFNASIEPSIHPGDLLILRRGGTPSFGDLVRCADPQAPGRYVVGRILGEPGDKVFADGVIMKVNNKATEVEHACTPAKVTITDPTTGDRVDLECDLETLGGTTYMRARSNVADARSAQTQTEVTEGNVFIASDDRYYHDDSRDFGAIPLATCTHRIAFRLWSAKGWSDEPNRMTVIR